jgi:cell division transport system permease protein
MARSELLKDIPQHEREPLAEIWKASGSSVESSNAEKISELLHTVGVRISRSKVTAVFTILSIVVALVFLGFCLTVFNNVQTVFSEQSKTAQLSIYIKDGTTNEVTEKLAQAANQMQGVESVRVIDKSQALKEFSQMVGSDSALLVGLDQQNPLPASLEVTFAQSALEQASFERVINEFKDNVHVESVVSHGGSLSEIGRALKSLRFFTVVAAFGVAFIAAFAIFSAVRLSVFAYQDEIEIMTLVGATPGYMRAPFIFEGALSGALAGIIATVVCSLSLGGLSSYLKTSSLALVLGISDLSFSAWTMIFIVIFGAVVGAFSSWVASVRSVHA